MIGEELKIEGKKNKRTEEKNRYILVAYDGSEQSLKALRYAIKIANTLESKILVVHACEESKCNDDILEEAKIILRSSNINAEAKKLPFDSTTSSPASEIVSLCKEFPISLIVIGSTGSSCKDLYAIGSTAASIAINSPVSVLIVR